MRRVPADGHNVAVGGRASGAAHYRHAVHGQAQVQQVRAQAVHAEPPQGQGGGGELHGPGHGPAGRRRRHVPTQYVI